MLYKNLTFPFRFDKIFKIFKVSLQSWVEQQTAIRMGGTVGKTLDLPARSRFGEGRAVPLWWKFKSGLAEKASAALFRSVARPCQITACQGFGDNSSQPGGCMFLMPPETEGLPFFDFSLDILSRFS
jgi:hypothetical protein